MFFFVNKKEPKNRAALFAARGNPASPHSSKMDCFAKRLATLPVFLVPFIHKKNTSFPRFPIRPCLGWWINSRRYCAKSPLHCQRCRRRAAGSGTQLAHAGLGSDLLTKAELQKLMREGPVRSLDFSLVVRLGAVEYRRSRPHRLVAVLDARTGMERGGSRQGARSFRQHGLSLFS